MAERTAGVYDFGTIRSRIEELAKDRQRVREAAPKEEKAKAVFEVGYCPFCQDMGSACDGSCECGGWG